jgi:thiol-disulfide isomerase/thioredoxin
MSFSALKRAYLLCATGLLFTGSVLADGGSQNVRAPELVGGPWLNTEGGAPLQLGSRKGRVTIVEFWTFACGNCKRNLPAYARWSAEFKSDGVEVIGIHTPETEPELVAKNVEREVRRQKIEYPVLLDGDHANWERWHQQYWPAIYVIDKQGRIRYRWEGELEYNDAAGTAKIEALVRQLLAEK